MTEGTGFNVICTEPDFDVSLTDVAVTVTVVWVVTEAGAVYVALVVEVPLNEPAETEPQVTPAFLESFATVAVMADVCPWSIAAGAAFRVTAIGAVDELQPTRRETNVISRMAPTMRTEGFTSVAFQFPTCTMVGVQQ